jgi:hypothetical protein
LAIDFATELADFVQQGVKFCLQRVESLHGGLGGAGAKLLTLALPLSAEASFEHGPAGPSVIGAACGGIR